MTPNHHRTVLSLGIALAVAGCAQPRPTSTTTPAKAAPPTLAPPAAQDIATADTETGTLDSKVTKVTVYSDRARVTRSAAVDTPVEATVFAFRHLPGWVDDGSVQVSASAGRIVDVRVDRRFLSKATDASWQQLEKEHAAITNQLAALTDEIAILDAKKQEIEAMKGFSLAKVTQDTVLGDINVKSYDEVLAFITASLRATAKARRDVMLQIAELQPKQDASARRLEDARA